MTKEEILEEMVAIYEKYFKVVEQIGSITISPQDKERLAELKGLLGQGMAEQLTQVCVDCGRVWEYTPTRSECPRCLKKTKVEKR